MTPPETVNRAPHDPAAASAPLRILLVEDDDGDALLVEELLDISGAPVEITRAPTLAEALRTGLALSAKYRPGRRRALLGGDFYDAVQDSKGCVHAVIGDVSGHGPDAAALGVSLRIAWRTLVVGGVAADELLPTLQIMHDYERH